MAERERPPSFELSSVRVRLHGLKARDDRLYNFIEAGDGSAMYSMDCFEYTESMDWAQSVYVGQII